MISKTHQKSLVHLRNLKNSTSTVLLFKNQIAQIESMLWQDAIFHSLKSVELLVQITQQNVEGFYNLLLVYLRLNFLQLFMFKAGFFSHYYFHLFIVFVIRKIIAVYF